MIVTVGGTKGGTGKSTVATNLAVIRSLEGHDVLLVDADDQQSSVDFTIQRNRQFPEGAGYTSVKLTGPAVRTETLRLKEKYEDIVIDVGGRDTTSQRAALAVSDCLVVPFVPRSFDMWTIEQIAEIVGEMKVANPELRAVTFVNKADARGQDNEDAAEMLRENEVFTFTNIFIGYRKAFGNAAGSGFAVTEVKPQDPKATEEMMILHRYLFDINLK